MKYIDIDFDVRDRIAEEIKNNYTDISDVMYNSSLFKNLPRDIKDDLVETFSIDNIALIINEFIKDIRFVDVIESGLFKEEVKELYRAIDLFIENEQRLNRIHGTELYARFNFTATGVLIKEDLTREYIIELINELTDIRNRDIISRGKPYLSILGLSVITFDFEDRIISVSPYWLLKVFDDYNSL